MTSQPLNSSQKRLGLLTRLAVSALAVIAIGAVVTLFIPAQRFDQTTSHQSAPIKPQLIHAINQAEAATKAKLEEELAAWRRQVMERVDKEFLDWHFSYMRRRAADIKYWWQRMTKGQATAEASYAADIARVLHEKVITADQLQNEMEVIATRAAETYHRALVTHLQALRAQPQINAAQFNTTLGNIRLASFTGPARHISLRHLVDEGLEGGPQKALFVNAFKANLLQAGRLRPHDLRALPNAAMKVAAVALLAVKTGTDVAAAAKTLGVTEATASALGTATAAVIVIAAIGAHEWWSHKQYVKRERPKLRKEIEIALKSFADQALQPNGRFGCGLRDISAGLKDTVQHQGTIFARLTSRLPENIRRLLDI